MDKVLIVFALWCMPSVALAAYLTWRSNRSQTRLIKLLHLEDLFAQPHRFV